MRDRTNLFLSYRQSYAHHPNSRSQYGDLNSTSMADEEHRGLMSTVDQFEDENGDVVIEMGTMLPRWVDIQVEVGEILDRITIRLADLDKLHHKHLLLGFEEDSVRQQEKEEIEELTFRITDMFRESREAIKGLDNIINGLKAEGRIGQSEELLANNLKMSLAARISDSSSVMRRKQTAYLKKLQSFAGFASPTLPPINGSSNLPPTSLLDAEFDVDIANSAMRQTSQNQRMRTRTDEMTNIIESRAREIDRIAKGIVELAEIFQEVQMMVIAQGTILDRIDYNLERTSVTLKETKSEVNLASGYQQQATKRKIILLLIIIIAGMIILLSLRLSNKKPKPPPISAPVPGEDPWKGFEGPPLT